VNTVFKCLALAVLGLLRRFAVNRPANHYERIVFNSIRESAVIFGSAK
jgi:hypothetical protein